MSEVFVATLRGNRSRASTFEFVVDPGDPIVYLKGTPPHAYPGAPTYVSSLSSGVSEEEFREFAHAMLEGLSYGSPDALESEAARLIDRANALRPEPRRFQVGDVVRATAGPYEDHEFTVDRVVDVDSDFARDHGGHFATGKGCPGGVWASRLELVRPAPEPLAEWERELLGLADDPEPEPVVEGPDLPVRYPHTLQPGDLVEVLPHAFSPYVGVEFEVRDVKRGADPLVSRYFVVGDGVEGGVWADGVALIEPRFYVGEQESGAPAVFDRLVPGSFAPFSFEDSARLWAENLNAGEYGRERLSWMGA